MDERPSWIADTLSGESVDPLTTELAALGAEIDHLDALLRRYERESDQPPPEEPPSPKLDA